MMIPPSGDTGKLEETVFQYWHLFPHIEQEKILSLAKELIESREDFSQRFLPDTSQGNSAELAQYFGMLIESERQQLWTEIKMTGLSHYLNMLIDEFNSDIK